MKTKPRRRDFEHLYRYPRDGAAIAILSMPEVDFEEYCQWSHERVAKLVRAARRGMNPAQRVRLDARQAPTARSPLFRRPISQEWLDVLNYLSGLHPLLCRTRAEERDLALTRELADECLAAMAERGVTDRHEASQVLELYLTHEATK